MNKENKNVIEYFQNYNQVSPPLILGLIVITLGLFIIPWIYTKNREFEYIDDNAPDARRGVTVILLLPFLWGYSFYVIKNLITNHPIIFGIEIMGWSLLIFLLLKYIFDFCLTFGRITDTNGLFWFILFFIPFLTIPAMQAELNSHFQKMQTKKRYNWLYN